MVTDNPGSPANIPKNSPPVSALTSFGGFWVELGLCLTKPTLLETYFGAWVGLCHSATWYTSRGAYCREKTVVYR
jgi:hypothetical protein